MVRLLVIIIMRHSIIFLTLFLSQRIYTFSFSSLYLYFILFFLGAESTIKLSGSPLQTYLKHEKTITAYLFSLLRINLTNALQPFSYHPNAQQNSVYANNVQR